MKRFITWLWPLSASWGMRLRMASGRWNPTGARMLAAHIAEASGLGNRRIEGRVK